MTDYRDRVMQERNELGVKLEKLERFIATNMNAGTLLKHQVAVMREYVGILDARISEFPDGPVLQAANLIAAFKEAVGTPAAVEVTVTAEEDRSEIVAMVDYASKLVAVTVSAPAGKRGIVVRQRTDGSSTTSTVVGGTSATVSIEPGDILVVNEGQPHSTVAEIPDSM